MKSILIQFQYFQNDDRMAKRPDPPLMGRVFSKLDRYGFPKYKPGSGWGLRKISPFEPTNIMFLLKY